MRKKKILLVSTNRDFSAQASEFLSEFQYQIHPCNNSKNALHLALSVQPDLVLCDDDLDVLSGKDLAKLFKKSSKLQETPFILLTKHNLDWERMLRTGAPVWADDLLESPITQTSIYGTVTRWLEGDNRPPSLAARAMGALHPDPENADHSSWKRGKIHLTTLARLFRHLHHYHETGTIIIHGNRYRMKIGVHDGAIIDVDSNYIRNDSLGAFLVRMGKISQIHNRRSIQLAKSQRKHQGQILLHMGLVSPNELESVITKQKKLKVMRLFRGDWNGASFDFYATVEQQLLRGMAPLPLVQLLSNGILHVAPIKSLLDVFARNKKMDCPIALCDNFSTIAHQLALNQDDQDLARLLAGKTITQIHNSSLLDFSSLLRLAFLLIIAHAVKFTDGAAAPESMASDLTAQRGSEPFSSDVFLRPHPSPVRDPMTDQSLQKLLAQTNSLIAESNFQAALENSNFILGIDSENSQALSLKAWAEYNLRGDGPPNIVALCKSRLKNAIDLDDHNDAAHYYLGIIFKEEGNSRIAYAQFQKALDKNPTNHLARREVKLAKIKRRNELSNGLRS